MIKVPRSFFVFYVTKIKKSQYKKCGFCKGLVRIDDNYCRWCRYKLVE